jgi:prepilin-type processing-associated H-X9-DG protein
MAVTEPTLMHVLANAAQTLAASDAPEGSIERLLSSIGRQLGGVGTIVWCDGHVTVTWHDGDHGDGRQAFADTLAALVDLAGRAQARGPASILDAQSFAGALDRVAAGARWRGARMALAVFELDGMLLGPGIDESLLVGTVGKAARHVVRGDDIVGHLGASQFALLFPRAGTFEARSAFRRVRDAVIRMEGADPLACGAAGFAELEPGQTGAELLNQARSRMAAARVRSAYTSPGGGSPTQPLAS